MFDPLAGAYLPLDTPLHRAKPMAKMIGFLALVLLASLGGIPGKLITLAAALVSAGMAQLSPKELFRSLKPLLPFLLMILLMNGLFFNGVVLDRGGQVVVEDEFVAGELFRNGEFLVLGRGCDRFPLFLLGFQFLDSLVLVA